LVLDRSEDLAEQVRSAMADADVEIVGCTKIGSTAHITSEHDGPFDVIVAGPSLGTRAGIKRLGALHREMPGPEIVMAFTARPDATLTELRDALPTTAALATLWRTIERMGFTLKKNGTRRRATPA